MYFGVSCVLCLSYLFGVRESNLFFFSAVFGSFAHALGRLFKLSPSDFRTILSDQLNQSLFNRKLTSHAKKVLTTNYLSKLLSQSPSEEGLLAFADFLIYQKLQYYLAVYLMYKYEGKIGAPSKFYRLVSSILKSKLRGSIRKINQSSLQVYEM